MINPQTGSDKCIIPRRRIYSRLFYIARNFLYLPRPEMYWPRTILYGTSSSFTGRSDSITSRFSCLISAGFFFQAYPWLSSSKFAACGFEPCRGLLHLVVITRSLLNPTVSLADIWTFAIWIYSKSNVRVGKSQGFQVLNHGFA